MKHIKTYLCALVFALALSVPLQTNAQSHPINQRGQKWWSQLELQLASSLDLSINQIQDETLQHIIFFAANYSHKIDLSNLTPKLLELYQYENNDAKRTMALVALHAIGNKVSMIRLAELVENEPDGSIRNITMAVLAEYFHSS